MNSASGVRGVFTAEQLVSRTKEILQSNNEFTPTMQEVFSIIFSETLTGVDSKGTECYRIERDYPDECERINEIVLGLVSPGFMSRTLESFTRSRPLYERIIIQTGDFLSKPAVIKTSAYAALLLGCFFLSEIVSKIGYKADFGVAFLALKATAVLSVVYKLFRTQHSNPPPHLG